MIEETKLIDGEMHIVVVGSIYVEDATDIRETFMYLINKGNTAFVVDLSQVDYMDSTGLGMLVFVRRQVVQKGGSLKLEGLHGLVKELFEMTHLDKQFQLQQGDLLMQ